MKPNCAVIIVAAGKGKRLGTKISKQFLPLCGKEILAHTVERFEKIDEIRDIILVTGISSLQDVWDMATEYGWKKVTNVVAGGKERQDSVWNGLKVVSKDIDFVLIHDGVRPFITKEIVIHAMEAAIKSGACVVGVPAKDTIKICNQEQIAVSTPDRNLVWQIQTPQVFRKEWIMDAYCAAMEKGFIGTDDASVAEYKGYPVQIIMGSYRNIKITTKEDLLLGKIFLEEEQG